MLNMFFWNSCISCSLNWLTIKFSPQSCKMEFKTADGWESFESSSDNLTFSMLFEITAFNLSKVTGSKFDNIEPLADIICNIMLEHFESEHFVSIVSL